ncbi:MAG: hypothetical protein QOE05_74 [Actinomycetota bacterium]|jgi:hypothetical protein|nr:hypothetical protein [Actinomycetota bacterium]
MTVLTMPPTRAPERQLIKAIDGLIASPSVELAPLHALERLGTVLTESERLAVVALDGVHDMEERQLYALDGHGGTAGWLRARRNGGDPTMRAFARRLAERPHVRTAMTRGELSTDLAEKVCAALSSLPAEAPEETFRGVVVDGAQQVLTGMFGGGADPVHVAELARRCTEAVEATHLDVDARLEPVFVFLAQTVPPTVLKRTLRDLTEALVPAATDDELDDRYDSEYFNLQPVLDGRWHVDGYLDPETGTALNAELDRRMATDADDPLCIESPGKRRAQALGSLARDGRGFEGSGNDRPAADITIVATESAMADASGALAPRMSDGTRMRLETIHRLGCAGRIAAVVLDAAGKPVGASGTHRNATRRERRALEAQWGGCAVDGCSQPYSRTRPHHVIPWWLSKITRLKDLAPVCEHHHHDIHEGGHTLRLRDGRYICPTGWADGPAH